MSRLPPRLHGLLWCLVFVILDAVQAVYFGSVLQRLDSFLIGGLVFGLSSAGCVLWTCLGIPGQINIVRSRWPTVFMLNLTAAGAWVTYLLAIQFIEPAVAFAVFCGAIPLTTIVAAGAGFREAQFPRNRIEVLGILILSSGLLSLALTTIYGWSGFVRGGRDIALAGLFLSMLAGLLVSLMLLYSQRLNDFGLRPVAQFGFRFPLYIILSVLGWLAGLDAKGSVDFIELVYAVGIGMLLLAFPIYAVQKAVSLTTSLTIGSLAATAPLIVFVLQYIEGRVNYSNATALGLAVYFTGSVIAVLGTAKAGIKDNRDHLAL